MPIAPALHRVRAGPVAIGNLAFERADALPCRFRFLESGPHRADGAPPLADCCSIERRLRCRVQIFAGRRLLSARLFQQAAALLVQPPQPRRLVAGLPQALRKLGDLAARRDRQVQPIQPIRGPLGAELPECAVRLAAGRLQLRPRRGQAGDRIVERCSPALNPPDLFGLCEQVAIARMRLCRPERRCCILPSRLRRPPRISRFFQARLVPPDLRLVGAGKAKGVQPRNVPAAAEIE